MPISRPARIAVNPFLFLSLLIGSPIASAQEGSGSAINQALGPSLSGGEEISVLERPPNICILTRTAPQHPEAPFIGKHPMRVTSLGVELGIGGPTPHVGLTSKFVFNPIHNYPTVSTFTLLIDGPKGYHFEAPVEMPVEHMDACELIPGYPDSCKGPDALTRFHSAELVAPAWPHPGMYTVRLDATDPHRSPRRHHRRTFEVLDHPLAQYLTLPPGYTESSRTAEPVQVASEDSSVYDGPSLLLCGKKRRSEFCIRMTNPISGCQGQLDAGAQSVLHANMQSVPSQFEVDNAPFGSSWCSNNRMVTLTPNRLWGKDQILRQLQEQLATPPVD
jgi:hypothetical protein